MDLKISDRRKEMASDKASRQFGSGLTEQVFLVNAADVELKLITGEVIQGELKEAGQYCIVIMVDGKDQIIYKHALLSIRVLSRL
jgi:RNA chaperone Hfq